MDVSPLALPGLLLFKPKAFVDERGAFMEVWSAKRYADAGVSGTFAQDNVSWSNKGVLRGLHFQNPKAQGKLISVLEGSVFDVVVDLRVGAPTFGKWTGVELSAANRLQIWVPPGFAHGFYVTSDAALLFYKCTEAYDPKMEQSIRWDDPNLGIKWPLIGAPTVSAKDQAAPLLKEIPRDRLFRA